MVFGSRLNSKRTFKDIRESILICLSAGPKTINSISYQTRINWKTVELHLTYLLGKELVERVIDTDYAKIFKISDLGREHLQSLGISQIFEKTSDSEINSIKIK